jgi:DNA-directed RNA polymerase subunit N
VPDPESRKAIGKSPCLTISKCFITQNLRMLKEATRIIIPVRCFTCGKLIGDKWEDFATRVKGGEDAGEVLDGLGVTRYCCRRMLLSHVDLIDEILRFYEEVGERKRI